MQTLPFSQVKVAPEVILDGRLAVFHETERWLAVADLHFGYELSQRVAGRLVPLWGMASISERLLALLGCYRPARLIILGDLVHDVAAAAEARALIAQAREQCDVIVVAGNHDRQLHGAIAMVESWQSGRFCFQHGHCPTASGDGLTRIIGHYHPAGTVRDGAGLRLKLPAFVQNDGCWIMPAFSPWAGGVEWKPDEETRVWLCAPQRILVL